MAQLGKYDYNCNIFCFHFIEVSHGMNIQTVFTWVTWHWVCGKR